MLKLYQSNQLERLIAILADVTSEPLANVFASEHILVQSQGMARWLSLQLARINGISANINCLFGF